MEWLKEYSDFLVSVAACLITMILGCFMGISIERDVRKLDREREKAQEEARNMAEKRIKLNQINMN